MATITPQIAQRVAPDKPYPLTVRALSEKWGPVFDVPESWIVSHAYVESSNRPGVYNPRGNAWGLMQLKPGTAEHAVAIIRGQKKHRLPEVKKVISFWQNDPENLLNPELNLMLGTAYLGHIKKQMKKLFDRDDHEIVAAAYNQGPGAVRKAMRSGDFVPTAHMTNYLAKIEEAKEKGFV